MQPESSHPPSGVTWAGLLSTLLGVFLLLSILLAAGTWWFWQNYSARLQLQHQTASVRLPKALQISADVRDLVDVRIDHDLPIQVPIRQTLSIPFAQPVELNVEVDTTVPIHLDIPVSQVVHIDQEVALKTNVQTTILGFKVNLPVQGMVPIKLDVPVALTVPIRQDLPVHLNMPVTARLLKPLPVLIDTVIHTTVPIHTSLRVPVTAPVRAKLFFPEQDIEAGLSLVDIDMPLSALSFQALPASKRP
jgi:hypothetical protein